MTHGDGGAHDTSHDREMLPFGSNFIALPMLLHYLHILSVEI